MRRIGRAACLTVLLMLGACSEQELYGQLSQRQANEMVAVLRNAGIAAETEMREGNVFAVTAPRRNFAQAVELLRANGYPRDGYDTLGQVFKKEGFVSSPLEEHARLMHALSQEIANTLSSIDGVIVARVHLSVPEKDALADKAPPAAASVFIKHRADVSLNAQVGHIKALVVNSIQGLAYDNVTVVLFRAEARPAQVALADVPLQALGRPLAAVAGLGASILAVGAALWAWQRRRRPPPAPVMPSTVTLISSRARS